MTTSNEAPVPMDDDEDAARALRAFLDAKSLGQEAEKRMKRYKESLMRYIEENGTTDDDGHTWIELPGFKPIKQELRRSKDLNRERAEEWAKEHGVLGQVTKKRIVIDFDETMFLGILYRDDVDADQFYDEKITPAFVPGRQT